MGDLTRLLRIGRAGRKGRGVFARTAIREGLAVVSFPGDAEWIWDIPSEYWEYSYQVDDDRYIVPPRNSYAWFINHSCRPNCGFRGPTTLVSMRGILAREELTFDYSTNVGWRGFSMKCLCGETNCRRVIRSYHHLSGRQKAAYAGYVSPYLIRSGFDR